VLEVSAVGRNDGLTAIIAASGAQGHSASSKPDDHKRDVGGGSVTGGVTLGKFHGRWERWSDSLLWDIIATGSTRGRSVSSQVILRRGNCY
jgi:hypothetical protein